MEKVKKLLDQTSTKCIYVSSIDDLDKQRVVNALNSKLRSIEPIQPQIRKPTSFSKENSEKFPAIDEQTENCATTDSFSQSSPIVDASQHPRILPDNTNLAEQIAANNESNPASSEYSKEKSLELEKSDKTNDSKETLYTEIKHQNIASQYSNNDPHDSTSNDNNSNKQALLRDSMKNENTPESSNTNCSHPPCKSQNQGQSPQSSKNSDKMISLVTDETDSGLNGIPSKQSKNQSKSGNKPIDHFYKRLFNTNGNNENTSCDSKINPNFQQNKEKFTEPILKDDDTTSTSTVASFQDISPTTLSHKPKHLVQTKKTEQETPPVECLSSILERDTQSTQQTSKEGQDINHPIVPNENDKVKKQPNKNGGDEYRQSTTSHPAHTLSKKHNDHDLKQQIHPNVCNHGGNQEVEQKTEIGSKQLETKGLYGESITVPGEITILQRTASC